jgi:hypothetical protein
VAVLLWFDGILYDVEYFDNVGDAGAWLDTMDISMRGNLEFRIQKLLNVN